MADKKRFIKASVTGVLCGMLTCVILTCLIAVVILSAGLLPPAVTEYAMVAVAALGAFTGALVAVKLNRGAGLLLGLITALAMFVLITSASLISGSAVTALTAIRAAAMAAAGALGGVLGLREKKYV